MIGDEGIEGDDFGVGVEDVERQLAGDKARDGRDDGEDLFLRNRLGMMVGCATALRAPRVCSVGSLETAGYDHRVRNFSRFYAQDVEMYASRLGYVRGWGGTWIRAQRFCQKERTIEVLVQSGCIKEEIGRVMREREVRAVGKA